MRPLVLSLLLASGASPASGRFYNPYDGANWQLWHKEELLNISCVPVEAFTHIKALRLLLMTEHLLGISGSSPFRASDQNWKSLQGRNRYRYNCM